MSKKVTDSIDNLPDYRAINILTIQKIYYLFLYYFGLIIGIWNCMLIRFISLWKMATQRDSKVCRDLYMDNFSDSALCLIIMIDCLNWIFYGLIMLF